MSAKILRPKISNTCQIPYFLREILVSVFFINNNLFFPEEGKSSHHHQYIVGCQPIFLLRITPQSELNQETIVILVLIVSNTEFIQDQNILDCTFCTIWLQKQNTFEHLLLYLNLCYVFSPMFIKSLFLLYCFYYSSRLTNLYLCTLQSK